LDVAVGNFDGKKDIPMEVAAVVRTLTEHCESDIFAIIKYWPSFFISIYDVTDSLGLEQKKQYT